MCVDFAWKEWEQAGSKWALRNIKLRIPRKLIFVAGLLTVFSCFRNPDLAPQGTDHQAYLRLIHTHLARYVSLTPLEIVSHELSKLSLKEDAGQLLDVYDEFLQRLDDLKVRASLDELPPRRVYDDEIFLAVRDLSHGFQDILAEVFFEKKTALRDFNKSYGVF